LIRIDTLEGDVAKEVESLDILSARITPGD
jgi:hypothetical protein